jgi:hypothetical protein
MRLAIGLVAMLALTSACIPRDSDRRAPQRASQGPSEGRQPQPRQQQNADAATLACHLDLARERIQFRVLPDQHFAGGCQAVGAVQLLDMGTPTTNLRAMTCPVARQFSRWSREALQGAAEQWLGSRVARIETFGTYSCRTRNSQPGARLSEHAFANAVDVAGFVLADGRRIMVQQGWNGADERVRRFLRAVHQAGCRRFAIGLSPDSDSFHYNHLHFDMGRGGPYCR